MSYKLFCVFLSMIVETVSWKQNISKNIYWLKQINW